MKNYSCVQLSLLDQMKLVYESNACSIERLFIASNNSAKALIDGSPTLSSASSSTNNSDEDQSRDNDVSLTIMFFSCNFLKPELSL